MRPVLGMIVACGLCVVAAGCRKEATAPEASAPAAPTPDAPGEEAAASATVSAPAGEATAARYLPTGGPLFVRLDARALFGESSPGATQLLDQLAQPLGAACRRLLPQLRELFLGLYVGTPAGVVAVVVAEPGADVVGCLAGFPTEEPAASRTETLGGREVTQLGEPPRFAVFAISDTVTVVAAPGMLQSALAAADGTNAPASPDATGGWLSASYRPGADDGAVAAQVISTLLRTDPLPPPVALALRLERTDRSSVQLLVSLADEAAATTFASALDPALQRVGRTWGMLAASASASTTNPDELRVFAGITTLLESLAVLREGATVRVDAATDLSPLELVGVATSILVPMFMKFVESTTLSEAQLNLGKIASLAEYAATRAAGEEASFPTNERVAAPCTAPDCNTECVPRQFAAVRGTTYSPTEDDWNCSAPGPGCTADTAWRALLFLVLQPMRFQYCWSASGAGDEARFRISAFGDQDGDGVPSVFYREGRILDGQPTVGPLAVENRDE